MHTAVLFQYVFITESQCVEQGNHTAVQTGTIFRIKVFPFSFFSIFPASACAHVCMSAYILHVCECMCMEKTIHIKMPKTAGMNYSCLTSHCIHWVRVSLSDPELINMINLAGKLALGSSAPTCHGWNCWRPPCPHDIFLGSGDLNSVLIIWCKCFNHWTTSQLQKVIFVLLFTCEELTQSG